MRTSTSRVRTPGLIVATGALALVAACGGSSTPSASSPASSASASATSGSAGQAAEIAAAQAIVDKSTATPTTINQTIPLIRKVDTNKTYVFLQCELSQCKLIGDGAVEAAKTIGWKTKVIPWKTSDPSTLVSALKQALQYNPIAVTPTGFPQALWGTVEAAYKQAGVMIVPAAVANVTTSATVPGGASTGFDYKASGAIMGNWLIADSQAAAHALVMDVPAYEVLKDYGDAAKATVKAGCAACVVTPLDITIPQLSSNGVVPAIVAALQKDTSIKYVVATDGAFLGGLPSALKAAGLTGIKIAGGAPSVTNLQNLTNGTEQAWTGEPIGQFGWVIVDIIARASLGMTVPEADGGRPQQLLTKANVGTPKESLDAPVDYRDQYKKLWGLS